VAITTVRRNATRKIAAIATTHTRVRMYDASTGNLIDSTPQAAWNYYNGRSNAMLRYDDSKDRYTVQVHTSLWFDLDRPEGEQNGAATPAPAPAGVAKKTTAKPRRGDLVIIEKNTPYTTTDGNGPARTQHEKEYELMQVTGMTRDGRIRTVSSVRYEGEIFPENLDRMLYTTGRRWILPAAEIDVTAAIKAARAHTYPNSDSMRAWPSLDAARDAVRPALKNQAPDAPTAPAKAADGHQDRTGDAPSEKAPAPASKHTATDPETGSRYFAGAPAWNLRAAREAIDSRDLPDVTPAARMEPGKAGVWIINGRSERGMGRVMIVPAVGTEKGTYNEHPRRGTAAEEAWLAVQEDIRVQLTAAGFSNFTDMKMGLEATPPAPVEKTVIELTHGNVFEQGMEALGRYDIKVPDHPHLHGRAVVTVSGTSSYVHVYGNVDDENTLFRGHSFRSREGAVNAWAEHHGFPEGMTVIIEK
jgi:hypothetical protein